MKETGLVVEDLLILILATLDIFTLDPSLHATLTAACMRIYSTVPEAS